MTDAFVPADPDAERALIGAAFLDRIAAQVAADVPSDAWYVDDHRATADAIRAALAESSERPDIVLVAHEIRRAGRSYPTVPQLSELANATYSASMAPRYAEIVERHARHRRLIHLADVLSAAAMAGDEQRIDQALDDLNAEGGGRNVA